MTISQVVHTSASQVCENPFKLMQRSNWQGRTVCRAAGRDPVIVLPLIGIGLGIVGVSLVAGISFRAALLGAAVAVALPVAVVLLLSVFGQAK